MAQDQSVVPEGRCGFEMLAGDVSFRAFLPDALSEAVEQSHSAVCWRQTTGGRDRCDWHAEEVAGGDDETVGNSSVVVLDGANVDELRSELSLNGVNFRYANFSGSDGKNADLVETNLWRADLTEADIRGADLTEADLCDADLSEAYLYGADLSEAELRDANLSKATLDRADLSNAVLDYANLSETKIHRADLCKTNLWYADLSGSDLYKADLSGANLKCADLSEANIKRANLFGADFSNTTAKNTNFRNATFGDSDTDHSPANLENAVFRDADLRGADFTDARLDQIDLTGARIDAATTFDAETIYEREDDVTSDQRDDADDAAPPSVWVHRRLERLHEANALGSVARTFHIRKQRARKRHYAAEANVGSWRDHLAAVRAAPATPTAWRDWGAYRSWLQYRTLELTMGYGEQPRRVVGVAGGVVAVWTLLYPLGDWVVPNPGTPEAAQRGLDSGATATAAADAAVRYPTFPTDIAAVPSYLGSLTATLADSLYFSTVTFTTLGFGDFSPVGFGRVLATVESALGVTLFAVLVFVLGRRATR